MSNNNSSQGVSILGLLGVAFVVLKLTKVIDWSWWYVTLPFYGVIILLLIALLVYLLYQTILHVLKTNQKGMPIYKNPPKPPKKQTNSRFKQRLDAALEKSTDQKSKTFIKTDDLTGLTEFVKTEKGLTNITLEDLIDFVPEYEIWKQRN